MSQYIPDITERFPEGFGGVDMTPSFFGEPVDWDNAYSQEQGDSNEIIEPDASCVKNTAISMFEIGQTYRVVGIYGGVTYYTVKEIDRKGQKILLSEEWEDVDGTGTRPSKWHELCVDEAGNERVLEGTSKDFGDIWIYA